MPNVQDFSPVVHGPDLLTRMAALLRRIHDWPLERQEQDPVADEADVNETQRAMGALLATLDAATEGRGGTTA